MTQDEINNVKIDLYQNILLFATYLLPHHFSLNPAQFHNEILKLLQQNKKYTCIVAPRGHAKSTVVTLAYILHQIVFCECNFVIIISDTFTQAKMFLDAIKKEIELNDRIKELFGDLTGAVWGEGEIETKTEIKVMCRGAEQKIRGLKYKQYRPDLIIVDDLENDELVMNKERRIKLEYWFFSSVLPALSENGRLAIIGTILHYDSLLNKLSKNTQFHCLFYKAIMNNLPLWRSRYTLEQLDEIKQNYKNQGLLDSFMCEYMNEPLSDENAIFKKAYFRYYEDNNVSIELMSKFITVDLAISSKETADYTVIMVCGVDSKKNVYVLEYLRSRYTPIETIEQIFNMVEKWKPQTVGFESVAYQKSLKWFIEDEMRRRQVFFMLEELKADTDKERRIRGLQPRYAIGSIFHKPHHTDLEEELILFPKAPHDDLADALAYLPQIAFRGGEKESEKPQQTERGEAVELARNGGGGYSSYD